jgi:hypothetical protein
VLEPEQHSLILRLLAGEHGGVVAAADRDIAGSVGGASEYEERCESHPAPALAEPAPALSAVKIRDQLSVHERRNSIGPRRIGRSTSPQIESEMLSTINAGTATS